jgi:hypothetical protein
MTWEEAAEKIRQVGLHCRVRTREPGVVEIIGGTEYQTIESGKLKGMGIFTGQLFHIFEVGGRFTCSFDLGQRGPRAEHEGTLAEVVDWLIKEALGEDPQDAL